MSQSDLTSELQHEDFYIPQFETMLYTKLTHLKGYAVVAFCEVVDWGRHLRLHFSRIEQSVTNERVVDLLLA